MKAKVDLVKLLRWAVAPLLVCAIGVLATAAHAAGVAMVTDLQGKATVASDGRSRDITILAELEAGARVQLAAGGTLVALYLDAGDEYVFKGPATIDFKPGQPEVVTGAKAERRSLSLGKGGKDVRIKPVGMAQGAMVMRGIGTQARIQLLNLHRTRTLEVQPEFRWKELQPGQKYTFELEDETGHAILETQVDGTSLKLPAGIVLKEGVPYTWEVTTRLPDGRKYATSADFAVAPASLRAEAASLRPAASAPLSSRIAYAAWLDQMELRDEARRYWQAAAAERPDDARLKALAAQ
jgi:hypothetical protein